MSALVLLLFSCTRRWQDGPYTRGIGVYPGNPEEYAGPIARKGERTYQNLALYRKATHGSSYDFYLTAQLLTDGLRCDENPYYVSVSTQEGHVAKGEGEKVLDANPGTFVRVPGGVDGRSFLELDLFNGTVDADRLEVSGRVGPTRNRNRSYSLVLEGSFDGRVWMTIGQVRGSDIAQITDGRQFSCAFPMKDVTGVGRYRLRLDAAAVKNWMVGELAFSKDGTPCDVLPSGHFSSVWMSGNLDRDWVCVDLGAECEIQEVRLVGARNISECAALTSKDGRNWKSYGTGAVYDGGPCSMERKAKARYVKVCVEGVPDAGYPMLSEVEVWGYSDIEWIPAAGPVVFGMPLLGEGWRLKRASEESASGTTLSQYGYEDRDWIPATVPGTVATSFFEIGAIPDIRVDDNQQYISDSYFQDDFWYRCDFSLDRNPDGETVWLDFDGINWKADVFLNGTRLGDIQGAFIRGRFEVTDLLARNNAMAVLVHKNDHPGAVSWQDNRSAGKNGGALGADNPTYHCSVGWDWIPTVRGRNIGIWNTVSLKASPVPVTVEDGYVSCDLPLPSVAYADVLPVTVVHNHSGQAVYGKVLFSIAGKETALDCTVPAGESCEIALPTLRLEEPRLWWPAGYGDPFLYPAEFRFVTAQGDSTATFPIRVGLREMAYDDTGGTLDFYVNGRRFVGNGGNWGLSEINLNYRQREYDIAVAYHADMGLNMIRNWVGQIGDEAFYEACDRHGVMVWQDFWLANPADGPDPDDEGMFIRNARDYVRRIRKHPCLALYVGRNEGVPPPGLDRALRELVTELHPGMYYLSDSADGIVSGRGPYRALPPEEYFGLESGRHQYHSERGMPNVPPYESLLRIAEEDRLWPQNDMWGLHDFTAEGAQRCTTFNEIYERWFGSPRTLDEFAQKAQWVDYAGYRAMFESRSASRKGLLIWMSHSCWPSLVWHTYDYYFEPGAAYFGVKKACAPIHIQYNPVSGKAEVVNLSAGFQPDVQATIRILQADGRELYRNECRLNSREDTTTEVPGFEAGDHLFPDATLLILGVQEGETLLSENVYWLEGKETGFSAFSSLKTVDLSARMTVRHTDDDREAATVVLTNQARQPALMVRLRLTGAHTGESILPAVYQDNFLFLMPGESKSIDISFRHEDTRGEVPSVEISGFNVRKKQIRSI